MIRIDDTPEIVNTALEFGSTYWAKSDEYADHADVNIRIDTIDGQILQVTPRHILAAIKDVVSGHVKCNSAIRSAIASGDLGMIDADASDVLLQVTCFGEIVYG